MPVVTTGARDYFPKRGTAAASSTYGRVQDSLIVMDEELITKHPYPIDETAAYSGVSTWNAGQIMIANGTNVNKGGADLTVVPIGMSYNDRNSTSDETAGPKEVTVITGPNGFRFLTDQVDSADTFALNTACFMNADGNFSITDGGGPIVARSQGTKASDGFVEFIWALGQAIS